MFRIQYGNYETKKKENYRKETIVAKNLAQVFRKIQEIIDLESERNDVRIEALLCPISRDQEMLMSPVSFSHSQVNHEPKSVHIRLESAGDAEIYIEEIHNTIPGVWIYLYLQDNIFIGNLSGDVEQKRMQEWK